MTHGFSAYLLLLRLYIFGSIMLIPFSLGYFKKIQSPTPPTLVHYNTAAIARIYMHSLPNYLCFLLELGKIFLSAYSLSH